MKKTEKVSADEKKSDEQSINQNVKKKEKKNVCVEKINEIKFYLLSEVVGMSKMVGS